MFRVLKLIFNFRLREYPPQVKFVFLSVEIHNFFRSIVHCYLCEPIGYLGPIDRIGEFGFEGPNCYVWYMRTDMHHSVVFSPTIFTELTGRCSSTRGEHEFHTYGSIKRLELSSHTPVVFRFFGTLVIFLQRC